MNTDNELLARYAAQGSEAAFRELVARHINLVYSAALRESSGNISQAEDITQAVFTELARRGATLRHPALAGWLYTCVRRMTANVRRAEERRRQREQEAFTMNETLGPDPTDELWLQLRPQLDDVMHELNDEDRTAVVLRFFERKGLKEVGLALGLSENAARMRVERSLTKLRALLSKRGVNSTASTLAAVIMASAVGVAPPAFAATVASSALTLVASPAAVGLTTFWTASKIKFAVATALVLFVTFTAWQFGGISRDTVVKAPVTSQAPMAAALTIEPADLSSEPVSATGLQPTGSMALQIVDADSGAPLPKAKLHLFYLRQDGRGETARRVTDSNGRVYVEGLSAPFHGLNLFVTADGHVPKVTTWGFGRALPADYIMKLERGVTLRGLVTDEAGVPIAGARIEFDLPGGSDPSSPDNVQFGPDTPTLSDGDGRWSCNMIPSDADKMAVTANHFEYAKTQATLARTSAKWTDATIVMTKGFTVAGTVYDSTGGPIEGAEVREAQNDSAHSKRTDDSGAFEFKHRKPGELLLAVQAEGYAPAMRMLNFTSNVTGLQFHLGLGQILRGRVMDEAGQPISEAWVEITRGRNKYKWSTTTSAEGRFEWHSAPETPLTYSVQAEGFNRAYALELKADGPEHEIKLSRHQPDRDTIRISGHVVDAETQEAVADFKVLVAELESEHAFPPEFAAAGKDGQFSFSRGTTSRRTGYQVSVETPGYQPVVTKELSTRDGKKTFHFQLRKGSGPSGVVLLPDGRPATHATVFLCTAQAGVSLDASGHVEMGSNTTSHRAKTDHAGRFSLPPAIDPQGLIVLHERGYAELSFHDFDAGDEILLQCWGRIEGRLTLDSRPVANERVVAYNHITRHSESGRRFTFVSFYLEANTDSAGNFFFDKVPPGPCTVFRQTLSHRAGFESHDTPALVRAGATTEVVLGGSGIPVIGKVVLSHATMPVAWNTVPVRMEMVTAASLRERPNRTEFSSREAYIAAADSFFGAKHTQQRFGTFCDSAGSFRLADVPPGTYQLEIKITGWQLDSPSAHSENPAGIASFVQTVVVADGHESPLDLGKLILKRQERAAAQ